LEDKLPNHKGIRRVGFVTDTKPQFSEEIEERIAEISEMFGINVEIITFDDLVDEQFSHSKKSPDETATDWVKAYAELLCLKRLDAAHIDEPAESGVRDMKEILSNKLL
jgi:hypothetical protein